MEKAKIDIAVSKLFGNDGRLEWLPKNPRQWTWDDVEKTAKSIDQDPDFLEDRPLLAVPMDKNYKDKSYLVFAGNLRLAAIKKRDIAKVPVIVYFPETEEEQETVKRRAMKDNGSFGSWDWDTLANEWDDLPLADWGCPSWETKPFAPNLAPVDGVAPITDADIEEAGDHLMDEVTPREVETIDIVCPHCGKTFKFRV